MDKAKSKKQKPISPYIPSMCQIEIVLDSAKDIARITIRRNPYECHCTYDLQSRAENRK